MRKLKNSYQGCMLLLNECINLAISDALGKTEDVALSNKISALNFLKSEYCKNMIDMLEGEIPTEETIKIINEIVEKVTIPTNRVTIFQEIIDNMRKRRVSKEEIERKLEGISTFHIFQECCRSKGLVFKHTNEHKNRYYWL